jgi:hypothetical protein
MPTHTSSHILNPENAAMLNFLDGEFCYPAVARRGYPSRQKNKKNSILVYFLISSCAQRISVLKKKTIDSILVCFLVILMCCHSFQSIKSLIFISPKGTSWSKLSSLITLWQKKCFHSLHLQTLPSSPPRPHRSLAALNSIGVERYALLIIYLLFHAYVKLHISLDSYFVCVYVSKE